MRPDEYTPTALARITGYSWDVWATAWSKHCHRPDWPTLVQACLDLNAHPTYIDIMIRMKEGSWTEPAPRDFSTIAREATTLYMILGSDPRHRDRLQWVINPTDRQTLIDTQWVRHLYSDNIPETIHGLPIRIDPHASHLMLELRPN